MGPSCRGGCHTEATGGRHSTRKNTTVSSCPGALHRHRNKQALAKPGKQSVSCKLVKPTAVTTGAALLSMHHQPPEMVRPRVWTILLLSVNTRTSSLFRSLFFLELRPSIEAPLKSEIPSDTRVRCGYRRSLPKVPKERKRGANPP